MPETPGRDRPATASDLPEDLAEQLAAVVLAVPGVVRLEPPLRQAVTQLRSGAPSGSGVQLRRRGGELRVVHVDVVLRPDRRADLVATEIRDGLQTALLPHRCRIQVNVLAFEASTTEPG